ncbi:hypothetical protein [Cupriavidus basilensis]|uniref:Uncharacterized protein n=1 Tax=Cupriavidus basilensis TaxID=68895 RepID=A0A643FUF3_9BURK|nr:hypothetical protein [Cupriavidus basilensis]QOT79401.1 hypothetical protein F7R26_032255 [Cupriavidus basilensis]
MSKIAALAFAFPLRLYRLFPVWADPLNPPGGTASGESADRFGRLDANPPCINVALGETAIWSVASGHLPGFSTPPG